MTTLVDLLTHTAQAHPGRLAAVMRTGVRSLRYSYADLEWRSHAYARLIVERRVTQGDRVVIWSPNHPDWVAAMFGAYLAGAVVVPLDVRSSRDFVERVVTQTEPALAFAARQQASVLRELEVPVIEFESLRLPLNGRVTPAPLSPDDVAEVIFTSGTTGDPKGVMLTHGNIATNVAAALEVINIAPDSRLLSLLPLSHMFEQIGGCFAAVSVGAAVCYPSSRQPAALMRTMLEWRPTLIIGVPQLLALLMSGIEREAAARHRLGLLERMRAVARRLPGGARRALFRPVLKRFGGRLDFLVSGGAALDADLAAKWEAMGIAVVEGYGTTECSPVVAANPRHDRRPGSVGRPLPGVDVRLAGDGEVQVRGPNVFPGYWRNEAATRACFDDGWYRTGDLGYFRDGFLYLKGRKKDLIVLPDGQNVYPEDIEDVLRKQTGIGDAAVLGLDGPAGVRVHAVLLEAQPGAAAAAVRSANSALDDRQQVLGYTVWPDEDFPRTHTLKVRKNVVLAFLQDHESARQAAPGPAVVDSDPLRRLIAQCSRYEGDMAETHQLGGDLGLDSLARVELLSAVEEQLGVYVDDTDIGAQTTVAELREMVKRGERRPKVHTFPTWPRWRLVRWVRFGLLSWLALPLLSLGYTLEVRGRERFRGIRQPCLVISNHNMHLDTAMLLKSMPRRLRTRVAIAAAASDIFGNRIRGFSAGLLGNAFPFAKEGSGVRESLEYVSRMLDEQWNVLIYPEGRLTVMGPTQPFKSGIGLLARETGVPVIPVRIDVVRPGFYEGKLLPFPRGHIRVNVGEPVLLAPDLSYAEATATLERAVREA